ncbi:unnamed protein product [Thlaspi arvense]|uniref:MATH domain-containing protein n=1 Tax=Thlaspi arvense TaxID=13288 RepID=A0AAU9RTB3_THLAR|nr:unnamed protein product [Thlaspi arvense]
MTGCDVCNHLSVFLCVANHHNLLPGWTRFAQFSIAVANIEYPMLTKDSLHTFWKKEHDWGWKKFIELPRLHHGFIDDSGSLTINAQVQVIRDRVDRPFPCLDGQYRKELGRVYFSSVKQIFLSFMEEKRSKFVKLIEDKTRWTSLRAFWLGMDQNSRRVMSREKTDVILKLVVEHFFIMTEVKSTFVMDFLLYGLHSLEGKTKEERIIHEISKLAVKHLFIDKEVASPLVKDSCHDRLKTLEEEVEKEREIEGIKLPTAIVSVDKYMFVLVGDAMLLIEKDVPEPLPELLKLSIIWSVMRSIYDLTEIARQALELLRWKGKKSLFVEKKKQR